MPGKTNQKNNDGRARIEGRFIMGGVEAQKVLKGDRTKAGVGGFRMRE